MKLIGLDTNIVIRLLTNDDPDQRRLALQFAEGLGKEYTAFMPLICVVELDWALRSQLGYTRRDASNAISKLLRVRGLTVEHHDLVVKALRQVTQNNADFADALIAARSIQEGCGSVKTFDKRAASRVPGMELLA
ncbi:MAG: type II toxin-antitoxin system VapC family toxin [Alphaproteobacteria bacterium]|nr:type II toxin-antitoxin system VapC family toxin [Rhizobiaceae bacterium]MBU3961347.1 type II toxin-antitoxin system VapC family toxin [Alphaproteobacteria bacterium]MBU4052229.1 type II toxin-antitoxin system VapC family toxin [Alphaproteobacteria bacterium]MBU4087517.1 type II toxin-antitoxin system VapC family toxin [Alphaproteobacteria bacterium]MBU4157690.1 type II toxin-antitoxin system VapC family toxin [Alphaproteobacteria bacterium]